MVCLLLWSHLISFLCQLFDAVSVMLSELAIYKRNSNTDFMEMCVRKLLDNEYSPKYIAHSIRIDRTRIA